MREHTKGDVKNLTHYVHKYHTSATFSISAHIRIRILNFNLESHDYAKISNF